MIARQARLGLWRTASSEPLLEPDAALALQRLLSQVELATRGATLSAKLLGKAVTVRYAQALGLSLTSTPAWSRFVCAVHDLTTALERDGDTASRQSIVARAALQRIVAENADLLTLGVPLTQGGPNYVG